MEPPVEFGSNRKNLSHSNLIAMGIYRKYFLTQSILEKCTSLITLILSILSVRTTYE